MTNSLLINSPLPVKPVSGRHRGLQRASGAALRPASWRLGLLLALAAILVSVCVPELLAQDGLGVNSSGDFVLSGDASGSAFTPPDDPDVGVGGMGAIGRIGHQTGPTVGQPNSISYIDINPYAFFEDTYVFGDGRLYVANNGKMGGTAGLGLRQFFAEYNAVLGASAHYDRDDTRGITFEQMGLSTELFTEWLDVRGNVYFPTGPKEQILSVDLLTGSEAFVDAPGVGSNITFRRQTKLASSMGGFDVMFTTPVPGEYAQAVNLEATAGFYNYSAPSGAIPDTWGWELRADADLFKKFVHIFLQFTSDKVFDDNLIVGGDINYWHDLQSRPRLGKSQFNRIAQYVRRNRTVVVAENTVVNAPELAINPGTGNPYLVLHVRNLLNATETAVSGPPDTFPAPAGNGSLSTPFQFISEAQGAGGDIIFVHADSIYDGDITGTENLISLNPNELILGEGVRQTIPVVGLANPIVLPRATAGTNRPLLRDVNGTAVRLASNSTFAGFRIENVIGGGDGIFAGAVNNALVRDVQINGTAGNGVNLVSTNGAITFTNVEVNNAGLAGLSIVGSSPSLLFSGSITNSVGPSLFVFNSAGSANLTGTPITATGGGQVVIGGAGAATSTNIQLDDITLTNTPGTNILVTNFSGGLSVPGDIDLNNPGGTGIRIDTLGPTGNVSVLGLANVDNRNGIGVDLQNNQGTIRLLGGATMNNVASGTAAGINVQGNSGDILLSSLTVNGSNGLGVFIGGPPANTGTFRVTGQTTLSDITGISLNIFNDASAVEFNGVAIDNRRSTGILVDNMSGTAVFRGLTTINNLLVDTDPALVVQNSSGDTGFEIVNVINALGAVGGGAAVQVQNNVAVAPEIAQVSFQSLNVTNSGGTGVSFTNNQSVAVTTGVLNTVNGRAIEVIDNVASDITFQAISATNSDFGILVTNSLDPDTIGDNTGTPTSFSLRRFIVTGVNGIIGSGGTISAMSVAGARINLTEVDTDTFVNEKSGFVSIGPQIYDGNVLGIDMASVETAEELNTIVRNSISNGTNLLDVRNFLMFGTQHINNGLGPAINRQQIRARMSTLDAYSYNFNSNLIQDQAGAGSVIPLDDLVLIDTIPGGTGSTLSLLFRNHGIPGRTPGIISNRSTAAALSVQWDGPLATTIENNNFLLQTGANQIGTEIITGQAGAAGDVVYRNNTLSSIGNFARGFLGQFSGPTNIDIINNFGLDANGVANIPGFQFSGFGSTGVDLNFLAPNNNIRVNDNFIRFTNFDGTGIQFSTIAGPSQVQISGNTINLFNDAFLPFERGIFFQTVIGTIALNGAANNTVTFGNSFFTIPFEIPVGTSTGTILVNGSAVP